MRKKIRKLVTCCSAAGLLLLGGCSSHYFDAKPADGIPHDKPLIDSHLHSSNYAVQGVSLKEFVDHYLSKSHGGIVRSVIMPLPLQQRWDSFEGYQAYDPKKAAVLGPNYYIGSKADLYYYSFTDAMYAKEYLKLPKRYQKKLDLMITGFNPMDVYAAQHIKRVLLTFPGAFVGIGEFTIHKEVVSPKLAGETIKSTAGSKPVPPDAGPDGKVSLYADSLAHVFKTAGEIGLVVTLHNDIYRAEVDHAGNVKNIYPNKTYEDGLIWLCKKAPDANVIWAHTGLGRYVKPKANHLQLVSKVLEACPNWSVDVSWDLVQDVIANPGPGMPSKQQWRNFMEKYSDRILWGSDTVLYGRNQFKSKTQNKAATASGSDAPVLVAAGSVLTPEKYYAEAATLQGFLDTLKSETARKIRYSNHVRLFDSARVKVRKWEKKHAYDNVWDMPTKFAPSARPNAN